MTVSLRCDHAFFLEKLAIIKCCLWLPESVARHHNHSGNIHVHIVINSLRIEEVPFLPYMDRPADTKAGCKHRCTDAALRYFKSEVMEMCHREGLYQIDLLNGSKNRVTDREYWAQKKGQAALDKQNAPMIADSKIGRASCRERV